jgi:hypothetical protein
VIEIDPSAHRMVLRGEGFGEAGKAVPLVGESSGSVEAELGRQLIEVDVLRHELENVREVLADAEAENDGLRAGVVPIDDDDYGLAVFDPFSG